MGAARDASQGFKIPGREDHLCQEATCGVVLSKVPGVTDSVCIDIVVGVGEWHFCEGLKN